MGYRNVGNTVAEWDDAAPLVFWLKEQIGSSDARHLVSIMVDLSGQRDGFTDTFLMHLKDHLINWRHRVALSSIECYTGHLQALFRTVTRLKLFGDRIDVIDETFLLALGIAKENVAKNQLMTLKRAFNLAPQSPMWARGLHASDFPLIERKKGAHGEQIDRILAKALSRAACVNILSLCERAYDLDEMDIGHFAFVNLAFAVFCRPESYRQIQLHDLVFDNESRAFFLYIMPAKSRVLNPEKIAYRINAPLGLLLQKQRQHVIRKYGHFVESQNIGKLALFPARQLLVSEAAWSHAYANQHFGMYGSPEAFTLGYSRAIEKSLRTPGFTISANVLRHTVGTLLAYKGASAKTIQAVLKHATSSVCMAYVDIAFHALIGDLSDAMQPSFETHMPVFARFRSMLDPVDVEQAIHSDDPVTGKIELTGECSKEIQCEFAPIACYSCLRFIPCWDADHGVNLSTIEREIDECKRRGKPFEHMVEKARVAKYHILLVVNAAALYRQSHAEKPQL